MDTILYLLDRIKGFEDVNSQEVEIVKNKLIDNNYNIVLFAPFNRGKSTLINCLLRKRYVLPVDSIPTTGHPIKIAYGNKPQCKIEYSDNTVKIYDDISILKTSILDEDSNVSNDIETVELSYPNELLRKGITIWDLPGTEDKEEQDLSVQRILPYADLVIQILDGEQIGTLSEKQQMQEWLKDKGLKSVIFVVNYINRLEEEEVAKSIYTAQKVADEFKPELSEDIEYFFRLDLLPLLRAIQKKRHEFVKRSEFPAFEKTLLKLAQNRPFLYTKKVEYMLSFIKSVMEKHQNKILILLKERNGLLDKWKKQVKQQDEEFKTQQEKLNISIRNLKVDGGYYKLERAFKNQIITILENSNPLHYFYNNNIRNQIESRVSFINDDIEYFKRHHDITHIHYISVKEPNLPSIKYPPYPTFNIWDDIGNFFTGSKEERVKNYNEKVKSARISIADKYIYNVENRIEGAINKFRSKNEKYFDIQKSIPKSEEIQIITEKLTTLYSNIEMMSMINEISLFEVLNKVSLLQKDIVEMKNNIIRIKNNE